MAPSYIAAVVAIAVQVLAFLGINVGSEELTTTMTTLITVVAGLVVVYRQLTEGRSTIMGAKPK